MSTETDIAISLDKLRRDDGNRVGGKNASLGEMIGHLREAGIRVPGGFATTAAACWRFIDANGLREPISEWRHTAITREF